MVPCLKVLFTLAAMASSGNSSNPILIETTRGETVESRHTGAAAVVDAAGRVVRSWGDIDRPVFARSAIKPLQALPKVGQSISASKARSKLGRQPASVVANQNFETCFFQSDA